MADVDLYGRGARDGALLAVFWILKIISWPLRLIGAVGVGSSVVPFMAGEINDPDTSKALLALAIGGAVFGLGYGIAKLADWLARNSFSPALLYHLAHSVFLTSRPRRAIEFLSLALVRDPRLVGAYYNRSVAHLALSQKEVLEGLKKPHIDNAARDLEAYVAIRANRCEGYYLQGVLADARGESSQATDLLQKAIEACAQESSIDDPGIPRLIAADLRKLLASVPPPRGEALPQNTS